MTPAPAYDELAADWARLHRFGHLQAIAGWDRAANMPPKGSEARAAGDGRDGRAAASAAHRAEAGARCSTRAEDEALDDGERANLREMRRDWRSANALPEALVEATSLAASRCEHAWRTQRPANDWAGFLDELSRRCCALAREEATLPRRRRRASPSTTR